MQLRVQRDPVQNCLRLTEIITLLLLHSTIVSGIALHGRGVKQGEKMLETNSYNNLARESNKFYDYYDYYYEAFGPPRVIDLDKYDLGEEDNEVFSNEDVPGRREIELEQNNLYALESTVTQLDSNCPDVPLNLGRFAELLCSAKSCESDSDCLALGQVGGDPEYACCFNGCVMQCLPKMHPPRAFDWIQPRSTHKPQGLRNGPMFPEEGEDSSDKVQFPGGCLITEQQMQNLQLFRKYNHVEMCSCVDGEILCQINTKLISPAANGPVT